jgi:DME family drug/metabolite transporter
MTDFLRPGVVFVLLAAALWGTTGTAAAMAPGIGPITIGAAAMGIGGLLQAAVASPVIIKHRHGLLAQARVLGLSAIAVVVFPLAFYSSMRLAGVAVGTVVSIGSAPAAAAVIERISDRTPLSRRWATGTSVGIVGMLALVTAHPGGQVSQTSGSRVLVGVALGVLAGISYALYSWGAGRAMRTGLPSRPVMGAAFGLGGLLLLPIITIGGGPIVASTGNLAVTAYLAIVPMFVGYLLFGRGLATITASTATTVSLLEPAVAALIAVVLLGERLPPTGWIGLGLLFASLVITAGPSRPTPTASQIDSSGDSSQQDQAASLPSSDCCCKSETFT